MKDKFSMIMFCFCLSMAVTFLLFTIKAWFTESYVPEHPLETYIFLLFFIAFTIVSGLWLCEED